MKGLAIFLYIFIGILFIVAGVGLSQFIESVNDRDPEGGALAAFFFSVALGVLLSVANYEEVRSVPIESDHPASIDTLVRHNGGVVDTTYVYDFTKKPEK